MGIVSWVGFSVFSVLVHALSAQEDVITNLHKCPKSFDCGNLGNLTFPFTTPENPFCGLFAVSDCYAPLQAIQMQLGGRWLNVETISQPETILINDTALQKYLNSKSCDYFDDTAFLWTVPYMSFHFDHNFTILKCNRSFSIPPHNYFLPINCSTLDNDLYYSSHQENDSSSLDPPSHCSTIQLPAKHGVSKVGDLYNLLSPTFRLQVQIHPNCLECYYRGGFCQTDTSGGFYCSPTKAKVPRKSEMKRNSRTHFSSFFDLTILLLLLVPEKAFSVIDPFFLACSGDPKSCDDNDTDGQVIVKYPFYIKNLQQPFCGYPGFEVYCNGNRQPVLQLPGSDDYIIHNITYENRTFRVSNTAFSNSNTTLCDAQIRNLTLSSDRYELGPDTTSTTVLFNCSSSKLSENLLQYRIGDCGSSNDDEKGLVLGLSGNDSESVDEASKECGDRVLAPVLDIGGEETVAMRLRSGFVLKWTATDCSACETSGGQCGFNASSYHFQCFCSDRSHAKHCVPEMGNSGFMLSRTGIAAGVVLLMLLVFFIWRKCSLNGNSLVFWKKKADKFKNIEIFLWEFGSLCPKRFIYSEIKKITNSFQDKLGEGGFGGVYHGKLQDGRPVAVKVLKGSKGNGEDFINEVSSISRTSHINIVTLIGFCFEGDKRALVYEFMANGSLEKFIYEKSSGNTDRQLKWETLYQIAVGIARGLEYLHRGCNMRILHFDIKPHNILLDDDFSPKISDFGLAKICPRKESIVSMLGARGTPGYIAPEVFSRNFGGVSHKSDVYSYGMMVFEMVGGRRNIDVEAGNTSEIYFPHWIYKRLELNEELGLQGIVDEVDKDCARKMILVSLWCIQTDPLTRPPMTRVVEMLEGSLSSLQIPPKPFLSSPSRSRADSPTISSSTFVALN